ncbi:MAG: YqaE/Pmp3 family membrane protein [Chitinophagaceae bacterium]
MKKLILLMLMCSMAWQVRAALIPTTATILPDSLSTDETAAINTAVASFHSLSKAEKKTRLKVAKKQLKQLKADKRKGLLSREETIDKTVLIILCIIPPLAVYLKTRKFDWRFWVSLFLTFLFWLPGFVFALLVVIDEIQ